MDKIRSWWTAHKPSKRRLIQIYAALLYNAHGSGFISGEIYTGVVKNICVPGLNCYSCPGAIGACPLGALQNALASAGHRAPWYVLGIILLSGLILGRKICAYLCPAGLIQELLYKIPVPKLRKSRLTRLLSWLKYVILAMLVVIIPMKYAYPAFCKYICPAGTLEGAGILLANSASNGMLPMPGSLFAGKIIIAALLVIAAAFVFRVFCRFFCPLGAFYSLFSKIAFCGIDVDANRCTGCNRCVNRCKMDIRHPGDHECIQCGECAEVCEEGAIHFRGGKIRLNGSDISRKTPRKRVKAVVWTAALALLAALIIAVNQPIRTQAAPEIGTVCPSFTVPLYGGGEFCPQNETGKPVIINFWATWCAPCLDELDDFDRVNRKYGDEIAVAAIHANAVTEDVQAFIDNMNFNIPFALDADGSAMQSLGAGSLLPHTVLLDSEGRIIYNRAGSLDFDKLDSLVQLAKAGTVSEDESEAELGEYLFFCADQNGEPVPGVMISICSDISCSAVFTDADGKAIYAGPPQEYEVHIQSVPDGYEYDPDQLFTTAAQYESMKLIIPVKEQPSG